MTEDMKIMQFLLLKFLRGVINPVHLSWTLLIFEFTLGISEALLSSILVLPTKIVPPAGETTASNSVCSDSDVF
jgi:hypothetical protein